MERLANSTVAQGEKLYTHINACIVCPPHRDLHWTAQLVQRLHVSPGETRAVALSCLEKKMRALVEATRGTPRLGACEPGENPERTVRRLARQLYRHFTANVIVWEVGRGAVGAALGLVLHGTSGVTQEAALRALNARMKALVEVNKRGR
ncbi:uncharacterized protein CC84DRAFT_976422 [Paraphaeosphaeria sporulosa]|uniref:Uncharacterized protein n=1 Tax=Paraphaeosphaeria sporulosa TaxID=1460663 RepID=A0A177C509_9PLEO|nr:uncharacterized protein CC84DRAFT_976422 [Paraphaeosphaeria sporulosa]OAG01972.1 hypothetical protein CC84DRAFT_976422 [Paraphaeosphaeria sporulosa]